MAGRIIRWGRTEIPNPFITALTNAVVLIASHRLQSYLEICGVDLNKGLEIHVQISGALLLELLLPFQRLTPGTEPSLALLLAFPGPIGVLCHHIPSAGFLVLISGHFHHSFLLHRAVH